MLRQDLKIGDIFCHPGSTHYFIAIDDDNKCLELDNSEFERYTSDDDPIELVDIEKALLRYDLKEVPEWMHKYKLQLLFEYEDVV
jgi:hypothetical protein